MGPTSWSSQLWSSGSVAPGETHYSSFSLLLLLFCCSFFCCSSCCQEPIRKHSWDNHQLSASIRSSEKLPLRCLNSEMIIFWYLSITNNASASREIPQQCFTCPTRGHHHQRIQTNLDARMDAIWVKTEDAKDPDFKLWDAISKLILSGP